MTDPDSSLEELRQELGLLRNDVSTVTTHVHALRRRMEQLAALRVDEADLVARIAVLERILDFDRVAAHVRDAVAGSSLTADPVPHVLVSELLPRDVYDVVIDAIPPAVFFEGDGPGGYELRVPPRLAPTHSIVTWAFLTDVVLHSLSAALVARFYEPLVAFTKTMFPALPPLSECGVEVTLSQGRIVLRGPGYVGVPLPDRPWDFLTTVFYLARPQDREESGSRLRGNVFPFRANSALTFLGPAQAHEYASVPGASAGGSDRYTYEFGIGPTREGRRRLTAMMRDAPARRADGEPGA